MYFLITLLSYYERSDLKIDNKLNMPIDGLIRKGL